MLRAGAVVVALATALMTACDGGGGQLAQQAPDRASAANNSSGPEPIDTDRIDGPESPAEVARVLASVESELRAADREPADLEDLGRRQQLAYRALAAHPRWTARVLERVPAGLRSVVQRNVDASEALGRVTGTAPSGLPTWEIRGPLPAATLRSFYDEAEAIFGVPWAYLAAIHLVETRMGRIRGLSSAGAQGPMQFIPETWAAYGEGDVNDDHDAIIAAARYLDDRGFPDDVDSALFAYNNHTGYVAAIKAYATVMLEDPAAYDGYYHWQVFYATVDGVFLLPEGWAHDR